MLVLSVYVIDSKNQLLMIFFLLTKTMKYLLAITLLLSLLGCRSPLEESVGTAASTSVEVEAEASQPVEAPNLEANASTDTALIDALGLDFAEQRVIDVYERVAPSVVSVTTQVLQYGFFDTFTTEGSGSGFVIDAEGHILTNYHVIESAQTDSLEVSFGEALSVSAELIGVDPRNDLAVLRVNPDEMQFVPVEFGNSESLQVGQRAVAIGNPFGEFSQTLTTGVISALGRTIQGPENLDITGIIQTDASINRGNSGGPLLDSAGRVIGINTAIFSPTGTSAGVGFSVPIDTVKRVLPDLLELGYYRHPWLGVGPRAAYPVSPSLAQALELNVTEGLLLVDVEPPLSDAGVRGAQRRVQLGNAVAFVGGDVLISVNGQSVSDYNELATYLGDSFKVGDIVSVSVQRGVQTLELDVQLGEQPMN